MAKKRKKNRPGIYVPPIKSRSTARAPHPHGGKPNPKRGTTVPAHIRINPRNGRIQVFVTPKVAEKLRGGKGLRVARNPKEYTLYPGGVTFPTADDARSALRYEREKYPSAYVVSPSGKRLKVAQTKKSPK